MKFRTAFNNASVLWWRDIRDFLCWNTLVLMAFCFVDNDNNGNCDKVFGLVFFFSSLYCWFWRGRTFTCVCVIWNWWIYIFCEMFPNEEKDDCDIIWNRGGVSAVDNGLHTKCTAFLYEMCYFSFIGRFGRQQQNDFITFDFTPSKNHRRSYEAVLSGTPIKIYIIFCWLQLPNVAKWK